MGNRRSPALLVAGIALVIIGIIGAVVTGGVLGANLLRGVQRGDADRGQRDRDYQTEDDFSSNGERIFFTGVGNNGRIRIEWDPSGDGFGGMMERRGGRMYARFGCATCHGSDGRGRSLDMMSRVDAPDIRYQTLTSPANEESTESASWTEEDIETAIREGVEPNGDELDPMMPRWQMDDVDVRDTIDYLKELD